ncbi:8891_t:CDS:10 [Diversispora eburnea]|uniref:8891_t:CDS:1 n=1 Tax=Diversispora eburnea TaxID=1213867 RepID=A0A9N8YKA4_9GLOM|nr:8891_t:CDS:10 [Diversispora eburnea]
MAPEPTTLLPSNNLFPLNSYSKAIPTVGSYSYLPTISSSSAKNRPSLGTTSVSKSSPPPSNVELKRHQCKEQKKFYEKHIKILELELRHLKEQEELLDGSSASSNAPLSPAINDTRARSNTIPVSSRSVPISRRNSNNQPDKPMLPEIEKLNLDFACTSKGKGSLPHILESKAVNSSNHDTTSLFPQFNGNFLLDDEGEPSTELNKPNSSSSNIRRYLQMHSDDDKFPILVRRDSFPGMLSASSAALDLAPLPQSPSRNRGLDSIRNNDLLSHQLQSCGLPNDLPTSRVHLEKLVPIFDSAVASKNNTVTIAPSNNTTSIANNSSNGLIKYESRKKLDNLVSDNSTNKPRVPKLSNSNPDLASASRLFGRPTTTFNNQAANEILGETENQITSQPSSDLNGNGVCRFFQQGFCSRGERCQYAHTHVYNGGVAPVSMAQMNNYPGATAPINNAASLYGQYGIVFPGASGYGYNQNAALNMASLNTRSTMQTNTVAIPKINHKRSSTDLEANRFAGVLLDDLVGEIYSLCKDQHGCRFLQKKLEEKNDRYLSIIFNEVFSHFVELMTDPFGNYLCQKLLEYCNDDQRTIIVETVAPELVNISLNMHGTRAVQKMIEFLSTPKQIHFVIVALNPSVVTLIKDLNGNHVIQKCLHRLSSEDNQFIYNVVSQNCIEVATHRHGCCVLQRCIDHASESQKAQLVTEITYNVLTLVQDPYGNYVVQYVLDLGDARFTNALIRKFIGCVCMLSQQKFSSNVIEKCIRVAEPKTRKYLIEEMLNKSKLDKLLRDSFANYVVQTSLDYADPVQRVQRIQGKLQREQMQTWTTINNINMNMLRLPVNGLSNFSNIGMVGVNDFAQGYPYF